MRIGEFAKKNNVSIDTIRHYMDLKLLIPEKKGGQYWFDALSQGTLDKIVDLKHLGFKLSEIKTILLFQTLGNQTPYQKYDYYRTLYTNKHKGIVRQIEELTAERDALAQRIAAIEAKDGAKRQRLGLDLRALNVLACRHCGGRYRVEDAVITDNQIMNGRLVCGCDTPLEVKDGIVVVDASYDSGISDYDESFLGKYIDDTDIAYLDTIYMAIDYFKRRIEPHSLSGKVILELGSGSGFSLRNMIELLPEDCVYIAVDHDIERHKFVKNMLERADIKRNIVFVCSDFLQMPIKKHSVDYLFDFWGTSNYAFVHDAFLLGDIKHHLKQDAVLMGSYIVFKNFEENSKIDKAFQKNFFFDYIKESIVDAGFCITEENTTEYLERSSKYENFFVHGEKIYKYLLIAHTSGTP